MKTILYKNEIGDCAKIILSGGLVAVPTETVYGLAANGLNPNAVEEIYQVKDRPEVKPLSLMVGSVDDIDKYCRSVPKYAYHFLEQNWPGPVTAIFKAKNCIPEIVLAGGTTVGLRCPDSKLTLDLIRTSQVPLAAPSANPSGKPSPKDAESVRCYFDGKIDAIIDGGPCQLGCESMILDFTSQHIKVLRKGFLKLSLTGITGQSGAGKTTVLDYLCSKGYGIIDCDAIYHQLLREDKALLCDLQHSFPEAFINNQLDRKKLGSIVFQDSERLNKLNEITCNYIICGIFDQLIKFQNSGYTNVAIDAVELVSSGIGDFCDTVLGVTSSRENRIERIMKRDSIPMEYAIIRVNAQKPEEYYRENCNYIIENNSTLQDVINQVERFINHG